MKLNHGLQLAYSTNVHRCGTWMETFRALQNYTLAVREQVCPRGPFAIGLRLGEHAAVDLSDRAELLQFQRWLGNNSCYVFTINGFPYGHFHGAHVKEQIYRPDWTSPERVAYTNLLFDLLAQLVPPGIEGSVTTLPGSFKTFHPSAEALKTIRQNLWRTVEHIAHVSRQTGRQLHLALEPEPLCLLESSAETIHFFEHLRAEHPHDPRLNAHLGVNYDTCHFAVEFEEPHNALPCLVNHGVKISKINLSSALKVRPTLEARGVETSCQRHLPAPGRRPRPFRQPHHFPRSAGRARVSKSRRRRVADSLSYPAPRAPRTAVRQHPRPPARRFGSAANQPAALLAARNKNLHLGRPAAGSESAGRRGPARAGICLDARGTRQTRTLLKGGLRFTICEIRVNWPPTRQS